MRNIKPYKLYFLFGGAMGYFYRYQKVGKYFLYQKYDLISEPLSKITQPDFKQWQNFSLLLDKINVWQWQPKYENYGVDDGMQWKLVVTYKSKKLVCEGNNNYPNADGSPNNDIFLTKSFGMLLKGFEELREKPKT